MKLVDTSIAVWLLRGRPSVEARAAQSPDFRICWITEAELLTGAMKGPKLSGELKAVRRFLALVDVLYPGARTCEEYARLQAEISRAGTPIPTNDVWIAALAIEHGATLVTSDRHFERIPGLPTENWME